MSHVSSYLFISDEERTIKMIAEKLSEMTEQEIELKSFRPPTAGCKAAQFPEMYFFAENYFKDDEFQVWITEQKFNTRDIKIFFQGEHQEMLYAV